MPAPSLFPHCVQVFGQLAEYLDPLGEAGPPVWGILLAGSADPELGTSRTRLTERRFVVSKLDAASLAKGGTLTINGTDYLLAAEPLHRSLDQAELLLRPAG